MARTVKKDKVRGERSNIKVLFIEAPLKGWEMIGRTTSPYTGYALLGSLLVRNGIEIDAWFGYNRTFEEMEEKVKEYSPDVVGIGVFTPWANESLEAVRRVKRLNPDIVTILGGYHVTYLPELYAKDPSVDFIVVGEGEYTLLELVQELGKPNPRFRDIRGLAFYEDGEYIRTPARPLAKTLDEFPMPAYEVLHLEKKKEPGYMGNYLQVMASRGCNGRCYFCSQWRMYNRTQRTRSSARVIEELELLYNKYDVRTIAFLNDDVCGDRESLKGIVEGMVDRKIPIKWMASARADNIIRNKDLLPKIKESGCIFVELGVESYSDEVLKDMHKDSCVSHSTEAFRLLKEHDIGGVADYIIGWPSETRESIKRGLDQLEKLDPDLVFFFMLTPWPGSPLWDNALKNGDIMDFNFSHYDENHSIIRIPAIPPDELITLRNWMYSHYYTRNRFLRVLHSRDSYMADTVRAILDNSDELMEEYSEEGIVKSFDEALRVKPNL